MSIWTVSSGIFTVKPKVRVEAEAIRARTNLLVQLLTLFSYSKHLRVDRRRRSIEVRNRWLWVLGGTRTIPFSNVDYIIYDMGTIPTSWSLFYGRTDEIERYKIGLMLKNPPKKVRLFTFTGEGAVETGLGGVLFAKDGWVDYRGDQDEASYDFVRLLRNVLGVGVNGPSPTAAADEADAEQSAEISITYRCSQCSRPARPGEQRCLHCGSAVEIHTG